MSNKNKSKETTAAAAATADAPIVESQIAFNDGEFDLSFVKTICIPKGCKPLTVIQDGEYMILKMGELAAALPEIRLEKLVFGDTIEIVDGVLVINGEARPEAPLDLFRPQDPETSVSQVTAATVADDETPAEQITIALIRDKKTDMLRGIAHAILTFERQTRCEVKNVQIDRLELNVNQLAAIERQTIITGIKVDFVLPA